jgi:hypothetical protein
VEHDPRDEDEDGWLSGRFELVRDVQEHWTKTIFKILSDYGCGWSINNGIVKVTDPNGAVWDFTVPHKVF